MVLINQLLCPVDFLTHSVQFLALAQHQERAASYTALSTALAISLHSLHMKLEDMIVEPLGMSSLIHMHSFFRTRITGTVLLCEIPVLLLIYLTLKNLIPPRIFIFIIVVPVDVNPQGSKQISDMGRAFSDLGLLTGTGIRNELLSKHVPVPVL
jgi:hypothetical protein